MKNYKIILVSIFAAMIGLAGGYILFRGNDADVANHTVGEMGADETSDSPAAKTWTCSMHPQIRQDEPGQCPICGMDLIPVGEATSEDPLVLEMTPDAVKLANIQTTEIGSTGEAVKHMTLSGKIAEDERLSASQVAHVPGRIEKLFVTFTGEKVNQGQELATLYSPELITAQQELLEAIKFKDVSPGLIDAARKKLAYWKIPEADIQAIEETGQVRETFTVLADASGVVTNRRISVGDYVKRGEVLFDIVSLDRVWVLFDAYEEDLASIDVGDRIEFTTPAIPDRTFNTRISFIDPAIDPATRVASLRGELRNPGQLLKPEMFVRGTLNASLNEDKKLLVPGSAVLWTGQRSVVYVRLPEASVPSFKFREVKLGGRVGKDYLVEEGLEPGDEVVTYGSFSIDAAAQLNNQASMMNRLVSVKGENGADTPPDFTETTPAAFKEQLATVTQSYLALKDALVLTDPADAKKQAIQLQESLSEVEMGLVKDRAHMYWMEQFDALQAHSKKISELDDVEAQRKQFYFLSQALIYTVKAFGTPEDTLYVQHCPMAFDNDGADWISHEREIRNPYFGDRMLKCGLVQDTIK